MALSQQLFEAIVDGKAQLAKIIVEVELEVGADPTAFICQTMMPAMDEVGRLPVARHDRTWPVRVLCTSTHLALNAPNALV